MSPDEIRPARRDAAADQSALLTRHCNGDPAAFAELVAHYRGPVYGYLVRCGVDGAARDDLFQEVFTKIYIAAASYHAERSLTAWIFTITANTVRSHYRKQRVRELHAGEIDPPSAGLPTSYDLIEATETATFLEQAIARLPLVQREVVALVCVEQLPQDEVAEALGIPVNTVKTQLRRARVTLAQALARRAATLRRETST